MRRAAFVTAVAVLVQVFQVAPAAAQDVRAFVAVHTALVESGIADLEEHNRLLRGSWQEVQAGSAAMVEAQRKGEDLDRLRLRESQLQKAESELLMGLLEAQRLRGEILANQAAIEVARGLAPEVRGPEDILTGTWTLNVQPDLVGTAYLVQQGTLVSGTYELSGDWKGSFRGTLVANKVRLERIDSQLGFAAIYYGELEVKAGTVALQGRWEATQLATGMPSAGVWRAVRQD
jgi:hypothetical protein